MTLIKKTDNQVLGILVLSITDLDLTLVCGEGSENFLSDDFVSIITIGSKRRKGFCEKDCPPRVTIELDYLWSVFPPAVPQACFLIVSAAAVF